MGPEDNLAVAWIILVHTNGILYYLQNHAIGMFYTPFSDGPEPIGTENIMQLFTPTIVVKAQNKLLKYTYLPRKKNITLSELLTVVIDIYLPT